MSVDAVTSSSASAITSAASKYVKQVTGGTNTPSSPLQEAAETPAVTAKEAAKGDPVAKRLLLKQQQERSLEDPAATQEPGKGEQIDQHA